MIEHGEVESALKSLAVRQVSCLWGRTVFRVSLFHWSVADGPPLLLLAAIDAVMKRRLAKNAEAGQNARTSGNRR